MKSIFNKKLFKEGLRQNFLVGIIFFVIFEFISIIVAVGHISSSLSYEERTGGRYITTIADFFSVNPMFIVSFILLIPIMAICAFSFLNSRNKSDFYHSIPHKRQTLFVSFTLSILTWLVAIFVVTTLTSFTIFFMFSKYFTFVFSSFFINIFCLLAACVMVLGAGLIAMSVTGTLFSNIVTAGLILFLPRIILTLFSALLSLKAPILPTNSFRFLDPNHNIVFGFIASIFGISDSSPFVVFDNVWSGLYTLIIGIIFIAIAGILFTRRKSEAAGSPALSKKIQATIRISLSFLVSAVASSVLISDSSVSLSGPVYIYIAAILIYFIYEAITAKSFKNLHKTLPGIGVLVCLNIIFILSINLTTNSIMSVSWNSSDVESISISYTKSRFNEPTFEDLKLSKTKIEDKDVIEKTTDLLLSNQADLKDSSNYGYRYNYRSFENIIIRTKSGKTYHRKLYLSEKEFTEYQELIFKSDLKEKIFSELPANPTEVSIYSYTQDSLGNRTPEQCKELYDFFRAEVADIPIETWANFSFNNGALNTTFPAIVDIYYTIDYNGEAVDLDIDDLNIPENYDPYRPHDSLGADSMVFNVTGYVGTQKYESRYIVSSKRTPKALTEIYATINQNSIESTMEVWDSLLKDGIPEINPYEKYTPFAVTNFSVSAYIPGKGKKITQSYYSFDDQKENNPAVTFSEIDKAVKAKNYTVDLKKPYAVITVSGQPYLERSGEVFSGEMQTFSFCANIDETVLSDDFFPAENGELLED